MIVYLKVILLFTGLHFTMGKKYVRHQQICSGVFTVDRKWELQINYDSSFNYSIKTINTRAVKKRTEQNISGKWRFINDTLCLYSHGEKDLIKFLQSNKNVLTPVISKVDTINDVAIKLDYLQPSESF